MRFLSELLPGGRLARAGFWLRLLTLVPLGYWMTIAVGDELGAPLDLLPTVLLLALLVSLWGRRLHDRGRSAWWLLLAFVPVIGAALLIIECGLRAGQPGANRFGAPTDPRPDYLTVRGVGDADIAS